MKKKIVFGFCVVLIISAIGLFGFSFFNKGGQTDLDNGVEQNGGPVDYPEGDKTPEHVAEVLGSQEAYEELWNSPLRKLTKDSMQIVYDTLSSGQKVAWVLLAMEGEVVNVEGRTITIAKEGVAISLYVPEFATIKTSETEEVIIDGKVVYRHLKARFEDIKAGAWLPFVTVVINAERSQARAIIISESP